MHCTLPQKISPQPRQPCAGYRGISCRSRLAGEEALKPCLALADAFAGKPAPATDIAVFSCRSRLAGEEGP
ncbi:hypothetical protein EX349_19500 [Pseudomonas protegens]|nr:hypothetical protein [Pseudomonas protegens]NUE77925.1 hypothetical protein [Pseudomonas protegens]